MSRKDKILAVIIGGLIGIVIGVVWNVVTIEREYKQTEFGCKISEPVLVKSFKQGDGIRARWHQIWAFKDCNGQIHYYGVIER